MDVKKAKAFAGGDGKPGVHMSNLKIFADAAEPKEEDGEETELETAAGDLLEAIASKDAKQVSESFKSMFELCESEPHEENEE